MPTIQLIQVHTKEQVEAIIAEAHGIAFQEANEGAPYELVFNKAVDLLSARIPIQQAAPLDLAGLGLGPRL